MILIDHGVVLFGFVRLRFNEDKIYSREGGRLNLEVELSGMPGIGIEVFYKVTPFVLVPPGGYVDVDDENDT